MSGHVSEPILAGRVAIVTGSGRGIGRGIVMTLAEHGAKVVVNDPGVALDGSGFSRGPADDVVDEIKARGGIAVANYDSVAAMEGGRRIVQTALDAYGTVDIVVTIAGIVRDAQIFDMSEREWDEVIAVHLKGTFTVVRHAAAVMRRKRYGRIITCSSVAGLWGNAGQANYAAAKDGVAGFTRAVARDLGWYGVTVNAISPGADTRMQVLQRDEQGAPPAPDAKARPSRPVEAIAAVVTWLASPAAANVTGEVVHVTGGIVGRFAQPTIARSMTRKEGVWTVEDIAAVFPTTLGMDLVSGLLWAGWHPAATGAWGRSWRFFRTK